MMGREHDGIDWDDHAAFEAELERRRKRETELRWKWYDSPSGRRFAEQYDRSARDAHRDDARGQR
jgi:hypothetical protein